MFMAYMYSRSPHGERGLKSCGRTSFFYQQLGRSPHGERGLKWFNVDTASFWVCRSPHGERGLKYPLCGGGRRKDEVAPLTGSVD